MTPRGIAGALLFTLTVSAVANAIASDITAASCNAGDVQAALDRARAGDTIYIPAGTCRWTTSVSWTAPANVTVLGAGNLSVIGGGDATVIVDDFAGGSPLISITTNATGTFRLAGITVQGGSSSSIKSNGVVQVGGLSKQLRIDHIHINMQSYDTLLPSLPMALDHWLNGVVDHIVVDLAKQGFIHFAHPYYGTGTENYGDESFAAPTGFGTSDFVFVEDSQFNAKKDLASGLYPGTVTDCQSAGRFVMRYNTVVGAGFGQTHPTGGPSRGRGCRAHEVYGNTALPSADFNPLADPPPFTFSWMTSGTSLVWGNTASGTYSSFIHLDAMRNNANTYAQTSMPTAWGYCGTAFNGTGSNWDGNTDATTGYPCIDQPGRGQSDRLSGQFPNAVNATTGTIAWPHQRLEPVREWLNTFAAVRGWGNDSSKRIGVASGDSAILVENRDYYLHTSSFNGTVGIGVGVRAARPTTCTTGVAYWSIDQGGNWSMTNATPNDGTLDVCTATNTWTNAAYTPYTYPHPVTKAGALARPTNLRIVP
jgi:hypothetical protein